MFIRLACTAAVALVASTALATGIVTYTLESPVNGQTVTPGTTVEWTIKVSVSTGDNFGLALVTCDLVQDPNNPAKFDMPAGSAASIPAIMQEFNRPKGITNPGEGGAASGFIGVQRGTAGQKNLIQIGGAQNTFGQAGTGFGTDPIVDGGVGQSGAQLVLSGSFPAPAGEGRYVFRLANAVANVLDQINTPPNHSPVSRATANLDGASFSFTVGAPICRGDCDCDGYVNFNDINPFVAVLGGGQPCRFENCDINGDGQINFDDINPFVELLSAGGGPCR
ncbi:MAG: EF-hand domain-containing protein [Planctomycetota bacterium]